MFVYFKRYNSVELISRLRDERITELKELSRSSSPLSFSYNEYQHLKKSQHCERTLFLPKPLHRQLFTLRFTRWFLLGAADASSPSLWVSYLVLKFKDIILMTVQSEIS
jgi:hypothetical protein